MNIRLSVLLSLGLLSVATGQSPVTASAVVQNMVHTTQLPGSTPVVTSRAAGTQLASTVLLRSQPASSLIASTTAVLGAGDTAIDLTLNQLALAVIPGASASYDSSILLTVNSQVAARYRLEVTVTAANPGGGQSAGVDLDADGTIDLVPQSVGQSFSLSFAVNGSRQLLLQSRGTVTQGSNNPAISAFSMQVRITPFEQFGRINQVLGPCSGLHLNAEPTFAGGVSLAHNARREGNDLVLLVLGFRPIMAPVPQAAGVCFWTPSNDITIAFGRGQGPLVLDPALLSGVQLYVQAAQFTTTSFLNTPVLYISDSYRLSL